MRPKSKMHALLALAAPVLLPLAFILGRRNEQEFLLGLSSSFWAGTVIGVSIGCVVLAVALSAHYWHRSEA